jgi:aspartyl-tRNA(Asn)/glutamyl-tRNA(Gln) amidotransferase subunit A
LTQSLHTLSATSLLAKYASRELSPVQVTQSVLAQMGRLEPTLCALWSPDRGREIDEALAAAKASEQRWLNGTARALEGVPVTLKENIATRGVPMPLGCAATPLVPAANDAPPAQRLREAGAVFVGKTTMPDWGMLSSGLSSFHKLARNPWDTTKNPGGSSAGAASACAGGYGPLHLGTDIGGSVRLPASWCGIVGFKPSLGRVPIDPPYAGRVAGPMTRTVSDAALMMRVLSQPDARDAMSLPHDASIDWASVESLCDAKGLRVGLWIDAGAGMPVAPEVAAGVKQAAQALADAGAEVVTIDKPFVSPPMMEGLNTFWRTRSWLELRKLSADQQQRVLPYIRQWVMQAEGFDAAAVFEGYSAMGAIRDATVRATQPFDVVLSPTAPCLTFDAELASPVNDPQKPFEHIVFTVAFSMSEQPAVSVPWGHASQGASMLPVGVQVAGRRHDDLTPLRVAHLLERLRGVQRAWPLD